MGQQLSTNTFTAAKWIVSANAYDGTHTTIASALTSASSGDTIFIRPGTYTENLTLKAGVNLTAYGCDSGNQGSTANVIILGKATFTAAGVVNISGIQLKTNSDFFLEVTGSAASIVNLFDCNLNASNNTGISLTSSSGQINVSYCTGDLGTTGIAIYSQTSAGTLTIAYSSFTNSGNSTTASSNSSGAVNLSRSNFFSVFSSTSTGGLNVQRCEFEASGLNTTALTYNGSAAGICRYTRCSCGTASAVSVGASGNVHIEYSILNSSNTNALTGAGAISIHEVSFIGSSSGNNVTTQTGVVSQFGIQISPTQPAFLAIDTTGASNITGDGTAATIVCGTEIFDQNSNYNNTTGTFTAPYTGRYQLNFGIGLTPVGAAHTTGGSNIVTSNRQYIGSNLNYAAIRSAGNDLDLVFSALCDMDAADTATLVVTVSGGAKTIGLRISSPNAFSFMSGFLYC